MITLLVNLSAIFVGVLVWREIRLLGQRYDDQEIVESAPVMAGAAICVGYVAGSLWQLGWTHPLTGVVWWWALQRGALIGTALMLIFLVIEWALAIEDEIEYEALLLGRPGEHFLEKLRRYGE